MSLLWSFVEWPAVYVTVAEGKKDAVRLSERVDWLLSVTS